MLSDRDIAHEIGAGRLVVDPMPEPALQPASVDVTLGGTGINTYGPFEFTDDEGPYPLKPGEFLLATTAEWVEIPDHLCCFVHGRSTTGRMGIIVETAGLVDPGFQGNITLELSNISAKTIDLTPGMGIAQLTFVRLSSPCARAYGTDGLWSRYQGQSGATGPRSAWLRRRA